MAVGDDAHSTFSVSGSVSGRLGVHDASGQNVDALIDVFRRLDEELGGLDAPWGREVHFVLIGHLMAFADRLGARNLAWMLTQLMQAFDELDAGRVPVVFRPRAVAFNRPALPDGIWLARAYLALATQYLAEQLGNTSQACRRLAKEHRFVLRAARMAETPEALRKNLSDFRSLKIKSRRAADAFAAPQLRPTTEGQFTGALLSCWYTAAQCSEPDQIDAIRVSARRAVGGKAPLLSAKRKA